MRLRFTKMQGAGNDFVMLDATAAPLELTRMQLQHLGDRHFGVGADQILLVQPGDAPGIDFRYRIFNNSGDEVEHCGNGARCFVHFVHERGLSTQRRLRVATVNRVLELSMHDDGRVSVDMGVPDFKPSSLPFEVHDLTARRVGGADLWPLTLDVEAAPPVPVEVIVLSMGNPHAVQLVADVDAAPVATSGLLVECHPRFARGVNAGFMQIKSRSHIALRVYERNAGETLACGTGACAAVAAGIRAGWLERRVEVDARGGRLSIEWPQDAVGLVMTGPAHTVYQGEIDL